MENNLNMKVIDGIIYRPSWVDTFRSLSVGQEIKLSRRQLFMNTAQSTCRWIQKRQPEYKFSVEACDRFQDFFIVKRVV